MAFPSDSLITVGEKTYWANIIDKSVFNNNNNNNNNNNDLMITYKDIPPFQKFISGL